MRSFRQLKNIAIVAHVDHGKTTLVDVLLRQSGSLTKDLGQERIMDSGELERERGITIRAKNCALFWNDTKINLLDTPGHADFGGEVERSLMIVDGILLLVDASEGPLPQTRFVLQKALERKLKVAVLMNKVDRHDRRVDEVKDEIENLFLDLATLLNIEDFDLDFPIFYASAREGWASETPEKKANDLKILLDFMTSDYYPSPKISEGPNLQLLVANLAYSPYLGQQLIGRIQRGAIKKNQNYTLCGENNKNKNFKVTSIQVFDALERAEVEVAPAGEIVIISGADEGKIGDSICDQTLLEPLPRIMVEPPTVSVHVSVSTSPLSGRDGEYLTSRKLDEFLQDACRHNVALKYEPSSDPKVYILKGRGELQLGIVFEELRREGFEFMVGRPEVILLEGNDGEKLEPFEKLVLDIPNDFTGVITEKLSIRKGIMENMMQMGDGRTRVEFIIPSRGLIGYRSTFLTDTKGQGLMSSQFLGYRPFAGNMLARINGAIISDRTGKTTAYALHGLLSSGKQFVKVGEDVYEGMVLGEHTRQNDINVNPVREKHLTNVRTAGKDDNLLFPPIPERTLDWAIEWIAEDEWVEVTPKNIRVRKKILEQNKRSVIRN